MIKDLTQFHFRVLILVQHRQSEAKERNFEIVNRSQEILKN